MNEKQRLSTKGITLLLWAIFAGLGAAICAFMYSTSYDVREMTDWHMEFAIFAGIGVGSLIWLVVFLIIKYTGKGSRESSETKQNSNSNGSLTVAEQINQFKKLCDDGVITQDEFEAKKKQLLDLSD